MSFREVRLATAKRQEEALNWSWSKKEHAQSIKKFSLSKGTESTDRSLQEGNPFTTQHVK
jgi:hypothetical protein